MTTIGETEVGRQQPGGSAATGERVRGLFLGSYHFAGGPEELLPAYERLVASMPADAAVLHICVVDDSGLTVYDACPSRDVFEQFSASAGFAEAVRAAGLPQPRVEPAGHVHAARTRHGVIA
jgi:hypothetical protein